MGLQVDLLELFAKFNHMDQNDWRCEQKRNFRGSKEKCCIDTNSSCMVAILMNASSCCIKTMICQTRLLEQAKIRTAIN